MAQPRHSWVRFARSRFNHDVVAPDVLEYNGLMKLLKVSLLVTSIALVIGCTRDPIEPLDEDLKDREQITYFDRNGDGKVDYEMHTYVGVYDGDWWLNDDDYDGLFETKSTHWNKIYVEIPVPTGVPIKTVE